MVSSTLAYKRKTSNRLFSLCAIFYHLIRGIISFFIPERFKWADISGQTVLITGGSRGLGQLMALRFLQLGCKVIIWGSNAENLRKTVALAEKEVGFDVSKNKLLAMTVDLADREAIYSAAEKVKNSPDFEPVEILVNNAAILNGKLILDSNDEAIERTFAVNTLAHFFTIKAFLPEMIKRRSGHLVCISSIAGHIGNIRLSDYSATKFATIGLNESLQLELAGAQLEGKIHTTIVKPVFVSTGLIEGATSDLVPLLAPEYVADRIVSAVRARTTEVFLPHYMIFLLAIFQLLPAKSRLAMHDFFGTFEMMANFTGYSQKMTGKDEVNNSGSGQTKNFD